METSSLNPAQQQAVSHDDGPMLVVAGAGTGKTHVITTRIARLITEGKARPEQILALTFTDKAAGEMLDRLDSLIGWQAYRVDVMTFHAFGGQLLQRYGHHMGYSTRSEIVPTMAKVILLKQHLSEVKLSYYGGQQDLLDFLQSNVEYIEALQNADVDIERFRSYVEGLETANDLHPLDIAEAHDRLSLFELYEKVKRQYGVIDYHDQIELPLKLLRERPNVAEKLAAQYRYVLVDEYQDTNSIQDGLLRAFVPSGGNIFAVGDDDQAIYGFRGARLGNILNFSEHYGVKAPIVLTENYRSTQAILDAAHRMIQHNDPDRLEAKLGINKQLHGQSDGLVPEFRPFATARDEQNGIGEAIAEAIKAGSSPEEIAVLATSHASLRAMSKVLRSHGVPYRLTSSVNIFEQLELLQLWHLLRWLVLQASDEAILQLLLGPFVGWSSSQVRLISEASKQSLISVEEQLQRLADSDVAAKSFIQQLETWRQWAQQQPGSQVAYRLVFETGLSDTWIKQAEESPRMVRVFEDLQLLLSHMQQYEAVALDPKLAAYMETFPKPPEIETEQLTGEENGVALLTIHASKGLEFDTAYIINNTGDAWGQRASSQRIELPSELLQSDDLPPEHERRRLFYVAVTRARQAVVLSAAAKQTDGRNRKLSPFLEELFEQPLEVAANESNERTRLQKSLQELQRFSPVLASNSDVPLPFQTNDGWLELSTTDIDSYDNCPYEFFLEKVLKIRTPLGPQASFGTLLHGLFQEYYQSRQGDDALNLEQLKARLDERWSDQGYQSAAEAEQAKQNAQATLSSFYAREEAAGRKLYASEETVTLSIDEAKLKLRGRIDAVFETADGLEVRDFKTGRQHDAEKLSKKAKESLQLRTYALAIEAMTGHPPAHVVLDYIVTGTEGVAQLSPTVLKNHRQKLGEIADKIRAREFEPRKDMFHECIAHRYWGTGEDE